MVFLPRATRQMGLFSIIWYILTLLLTFTSLYPLYYKYAAICGKNKRHKEQRKFMKRIIKLFLPVMLITSLLMTITAQAMADETQPGQPHICMTSESITEGILKHIGNRDGHFTVSLSSELPQAGADCAELLFYALNQDSGFARWGFKSARASRANEGAFIAYKYWVTYRTTLEDDNAAKNLAASLVKNWDISDLSNRQKADLLRSYITAHWRYDETLKNDTAYPALSENKGSCLGFVMASQLVFENMNVKSRAVKGIENNTATPHILLLVKLDDLWYTFDPTELAREKPGMSSYLKSSYADYFTPDAMYTSASFRHEYPMIESD